MPLPLILAGAALKLSPIGKFLKDIPREVWIGLAVLALIAGGVIYHKRAVSNARTEGHAAGVKAEGERIAAKVLELKVKADKLAADIRRKNDATNRAIAGDADALRVRGAGKASCLGPAASSAGGRVAPGGKADAAVDPLPGRERVELIGLPFADLVNAAERCDLNRAEVLSWREWHKKLVEMK